MKIVQRTSKDIYGDDLNPEMIEQGINRLCYQKMMEEARRLWGNVFGNFVCSVVSAQDDSFFIHCDTWMKLRARFECYKDG